jgi:hypothetical protein
MFELLRRFERPLADFVPARHFEQVLEEGRGGAEWNPRYLSALLYCHAFQHAPHRQVIVTRETN